MRSNFNLWSIILAGGEGERTKDFIRSTLGHDKPKQYCRFIGRRSLIQHTIDRADVLSPSGHRVVVARCHHRPELTAQLAGRDPGEALYQPSNRGTAAGVFLPLAQVLSHDTAATVVIYPSDHFVYPEEAFLHTIEDALSLCSQAPDRVLLLGARPDGPETDYGWIRPGARLEGSGSKLREVDRFVEKPPMAIAEETARGGGLWNTSIVIARADRLWQLGWQVLPEVMPWFAAIARRQEDIHEPSVLERIYRSVPVRDFSHDLLERAARHLAVMEADGFFWSDWGRPSRILEVLEGFGKSLNGNGNANADNRGLGQMPETSGTPTPSVQAEVVRRQESAGSAHRSTSPHPASA